jgi:hypothetical protein
VKPCNECVTARERADAAVREARAVATAFEELQDKVYRWMQRTNKRDRDETREDAPGAPIPPTPGARLARPLTIPERVNLRRFRGV